MTRGVRTTWTSIEGRTYDLTLDTTEGGQVVITKAYRQRPDQQRVRAPGMEITAPIELFHGLDPDTLARLESRLEKTA